MRGATVACVGVEGQLVGIGSFYLHPHYPQFPVIEFRPSGSVTSAFFTQRAVSLAFDFVVVVDVASKVNV